MSSRALRKLHGDSEITIPNLPEHGDDGSDDEEIDVPQPRGKKNKSKNKKKAAAVINPFDLLNEAGDENEEKAEVNDKSDDEPVPDLNKEAQPVVASTKKKKKKKKKQSQEAKDTAVKANEDEIDASIREVNELLGELPSNQSGLSFNSDSSTTMSMRSLLSVDHRNLIADNEMKRIFGSSVVQSEQARRRGRNQQYKRPSKLTQPKDSWPSISKSGLSMKLLESQRGNHYFTFEHNRQYQQVQFDFLDAVESFNPDNIVQVLRLHPYHIDAQLQLSEVCRMSEDTPMATELIERALYTFELSFHTTFSLTQGNCRLDYRRPENRAFYLALFRQLIFVGMKGCYKTALEFCKLILSFDPDGDPLCILLLIDFYALRSEEYSFLVRMHNEWEAHRNLSQLPNFAFSTALATFHIALQESEDTTQADDMLQVALLMFPGLLIPLLDKCSIKPDSQVAAHTFFGTTAQLSQSPSLQQLVGLYVGRCFSCWKAPEVVEWLERNVRAVLSRVDQGEPLVEENAKKRQVRYKGTPRNVFRHIVISEVKDASSALPPEMANTPVMSYDPLPPTDSIVSYTRPPRPRRIDQDQGSLGLFFRSLLPNYNPNEAPLPQEQGAVGGEGGNPEFRQGVNALMNAMRDLLSNIQMAPPPREDGHRDDNGDQEEQRPDEEWD